MLEKGSLIHFVQIGARLTIEEMSMVMIIPILIYMVISQKLRDFLLWNALCQILLFIPVVQIPAFIFNRMSYVDIGWPFGLVLISINGFIYGDGLPIRKYISCGLLFLHGFRMGFGALVLFGQETNYTYKFKQDLPRYQYAKLRWIEFDGMSEKHWWLKIQHDCFQQCFANMCLLALPTAMCAFNKDPELHVVEIIGWATWVIAYTFENIADIQKQVFLSNVSKLRKANKLLTKKSKKGGKQDENNNENQDGKKVNNLPCYVLGYKPFDTKQYYLWTLSRHPNYFGELFCWIGFALTASASVSFSTIESKFNKGVSNMILYMSLMLLVRVFYDCLVWWTGAAPAEHFSCLKRKPYYQLYQQSTPVLFPFSFIGIGEGRIADWPNKEEDDEVDAKTK